MVIRRGIDAGTPIADVLARELQLAPWMIDHLRQHWDPFLFFDRGYHPDRCWDVGGMLSLWTPETAPTTLDDLHRLNALLHPRHDRVSPLYRSIAMPIGAQDRRQLRELVQHEGAFRQMQGYLHFLHSLTQWLENSLGVDSRTEIGRLLEANNLTDWGVLNRRFQDINGTQRGRVRPPEGHLAAPIQLFWPSLLTKEEPIGEFRFRCLQSTIDLSDESQRMKNCASKHVGRCMFGESHLLHIATGETPIGTLEVKKEMYGENAILLLVHSEGIARAPLVHRRRTRGGGVPGWV